MAHQQLRMNLFKDDAGTTPHLDQEEDAACTTQAFKPSQSAHTRRNYLRAATAFEEWCGARGLTALPATPPTVAAYLADMAGRGWRPATLRATRAAVANAHRQAGREDPTASREVKEELAKLVREATHPQTRTSGLTAEVMAQIRKWACRPRRLGRGSRLEFEADATRRGLVDIAIASVMRDAMLRPSEAAALRWGDVESLPDGAGQIHRDSADQKCLFIGPDAVRDLQAIRPAGAVPKEHVFGLVAETISRRLKAAAVAAGLAEDFSGISPRVGMARDLSAHGAGISALMAAGRWRSPGMPAKYTSVVDDEEGAVARYHRSGGATQPSALPETPPELAGRYG